MARPQLTTDQITARTWPVFVERWRSKGLPWCDTCEQPAIRVPLEGWRHAGIGALPIDPEPAGHPVTALQWHAGHDRPDDPTPVLVAITEDDPR